MGEKSGGVMLSIYGALIGGMIAVFSAALVFTLFVDVNGPDGNTPLVAVLLGIGMAAIYLVGGMVLDARASWLSAALLFASGFTVFWSGILSVTLRSRWAAVLAFGGLIVLGIVLGWWKFGREASA